MPGAVIDATVADLLLATLTPFALEVAMSVSDELIHQAQRADSLRAASVQRAQHAADQARRRYLAVDPGNRLVADALEADWNARLRELADAQDHYTAAKATAAALDEQQRARIRALAADLPALWNDPATPARERKRLPNRECLPPVPAMVMMALRGVSGRWRWPLGHGVRGRRGVARAR